MRYLLIACCVFFFASCSSSKEETTTNAASSLGTNSSDNTTDNSSSSSGTSGSNTVDNSSSSVNVTLTLLSKNMWMTQCTSAGNTYYTISKIFFTTNGDNSTLESVYYSDSACQSSIYTFRDKVENFMIGEVVNMSGDNVTRYTNTKIDSTLEPLTSAYVTSFNTNSYCGISSWVLNQETSISGKTCGTTTFAPQGYMYKNVLYYASDGSYIQIGNRGGFLTSDGYPSALAAEKYYRL